MQGAAQVRCWVRSVAQRVGPRRRVVQQSVADSGSLGRSGREGHNRYRGRQPSVSVAPEGRCDAAGGRRTTGRGLFGVLSEPRRRRRTRNVRERASSVGGWRDPARPSWRHLYTAVVEPEEVLGWPWVQHGVRAIRRVAPRARSWTGRRGRSRHPTAAAQSSQSSRPRVVRAATNSEVATGSLWRSRSEERHAHRILRAAGAIPRWEHKGRPAVPSTKGHSGP